MDKGELAILSRIASDPPGLLQCRRPQFALHHTQYNVFVFIFIETAQVLGHNIYTRI